MATKCALLAKTNHKKQAKEDRKRVEFIKEHIAKLGPQAAAKYLMGFDLIVAIHCWKSVFFYDDIYSYL